MTQGTMFISLLEVAEVNLDVDALLVGLILLDVDNFVNCSSHVEFCFVLSEFACFHLGHPKYIFHMK